MNIRRGRGRAHLRCCPSGRTQRQAMGCVELDSAGILAAKQTHRNICTLVDSSGIDKRRSYILHRESVRVTPTKMHAARTSSKMYVSVFPTTQSRGKIAVISPSAQHYIIEASSRTPLLKLNRTSIIFLPRPVTNTPVCFN